MDPVTGEATVSGTGYILKWASVRELEEGRAAWSVEYPKFYQNVSRAVGNGFEPAKVPLNLKEEMPWDRQFYTSYSRPAEGDGFERIAILGGVAPPQGVDHR